MRTPNKRVAAGYDVVVWVDDDGDIVAKAFTSLGHNTLRKFVSEYRSGDIVQIYCDPDQFLKEIDEVVSIGTLASDGSVTLMTGIHLH